MAKKRLSVVYKCSACGYTQPAWLGRCPSCGQWNTMEEHVNAPNANAALMKGDGTSLKAKPLPLGKIEMTSQERLSTGSSEFDRVLGGGATKRSAILIGGEPGIGKSTLLIQTAAALLEKKAGQVLYVSGEESASQIKGRALRLGLARDDLEILCTLRLEDILDALENLNPVAVIIDSIQTVYSVEAGIIPGTINQLKYCANELIGWVKERDSLLFMTAHVTKDGNIAGPKSLEHMVDTVISFERNNDEVRFLRAMKNRFGSVDELGIFEMSEKGLKAVKDPSALFLTRREGTLPPGVAYVPVFEGSRVFVVEIQALTVAAKGALNRVYSDKVDSARVSRVAAVLEKRGGLRFCDQDIYINVAGGMKLSESAIDAALAAALYSARADIPLPAKTVIVGELSLAGEIRPVTKLKQRLKAANDLGFNRALVSEKIEGATVVESIGGMVRELFGE